MNVIGGNVIFDVFLWSGDVVVKEFIFEKFLFECEESKVFCDDIVCKILVLKVFWEVVFFGFKFLMMDVMVDEMIDGKERFENIILENEVVILVVLIFDELIICVIIGVIVVLIMLDLIREVFKVFDMFLVVWFDNLIVDVVFDLVVLLVIRFIVCDKFNVVEVLFIRGVVDVVLISIEYEIKEVKEFVVMKLEWMKLKYEDELIFLFIVYVDVILNVFFFMMLIFDVLLRRDVWWFVDWFFEVWFVFNDFNWDKWGVELFLVGIDMIVVFLLVVLIKMFVMFVDRFELDGLIIEVVFKGEFCGINIDDSVKFVWVLMIGDEFIIRLEMVGVNDKCVFVVVISNIEDINGVVDIFVDIEKLFGSIEVVIIFEDEIFVRVIMVERVFFLDDVSEGNFIVFEFDEWRVLLRLNDECLGMSDVDWLGIVLVKRVFRGEDCSERVFFCIEVSDEKNGDVEFVLCSIFCVLFKDLFILEEEDVVM